MSDDSNPNEGMGKAGADAQYGDGVPGTDPGVNALIGIGGVGWQGSGSVGGEAGDNTDSGSGGLSF